jgi:hypothetical protein
MKITKSYLKQIIKEELEKTLSDLDEQQLEEGKLQTFLASLAAAATMFGGAAKADEVKIKMHHRLTGEPYEQVVNIPGVNAGMDKFDMRQIASDFIDKKSEKAGLPIATFVVDNVELVQKAPAPATASIDQNIKIKDLGDSFEVTVMAKDAGTAQLKASTQILKKMGIVNKAKTLNVTSTQRTGADEYKVTVEKPGS